MVTYAYDLSGYVMENEVSELDQKRLYEIWLGLGNVFHILSNGDDAAGGAEELEPLMEQLQQIWDCPPFSAAPIEQSPAPGLLGDPKP